MLMKAWYLHVTQNAVTNQPFADERSVDFCPMLAEFFLRDARVAPEVDREADHLLRSHDRVSTVWFFAGRRFLDQVFEIPKRKDLRDLYFPRRT